MVGFYPAGNCRWETNRLQLGSASWLPGQEESFRICPFSAQLERSEIFVPVSHGNFRICFNPQSQLIQIRKGDAAIAHSLDQVSPQRLGKPGPLLDLWHYLPKTICPSSSPRRSTSFGSVAARKCSASSKKALSFCFFASIPSSRSSTSIRLALRRRRFAMLRTWVATFAGRVTLWRTVLSLDVMTPVCTRVV